jgi:hypothetical protein
MSEGTATPWLTSQLVGEIVNPRVYRSVGVDPKQGRKIAHRNPHFQQTVHHWGERIMGFLDEADLIGGPSTIICKRSMLLK